MRETDPEMTLIICGFAPFLVSKAQTLGARLALKPGAVWHMRTFQGEHEGMAACHQQQPVDTSHLISM